MKNEKGSKGNDAGGRRPDISCQKFNLKIAVWKPDGGFRSPSALIERGIRIPNTKEYVENPPQIRCFCSDLVLLRNMLNEVISQMEKDGGYPLEFKPKA